MKQKLLQIFILLVCAGAIGYSLYSVFYQPYFVLPRQDRAFLAARPSHDQVLQRFGRPAEQLRSGERFPMTDWYPLPDRAATGSAVSFVRRYGSKLYVFFGPGGKIEHYVIAHS